MLNGEMHNSNSCSNSMIHVISNYFWTLLLVIYFFKFTKRDEGYIFVIYAIHFFFAFFPEKIYDLLWPSTTPFINPCINFDRSVCTRRISKGRDEMEITTEIMGFGFRVTQRR